MDCTDCEGQCPALAPENAEAWQLVRHILTQVRTSGMGDVIGFDYPAVRLIASTFGITMSPGVWGKVRAVEMAMRMAAAKKQQTVG